MQFLKFHHKTKTENRKPVPITNRKWQMLRDFTPSKMVSLYDRSGHWSWTFT